MVTDEMVERAAETYWREHWGVFGNAQKEDIKQNMRLSLETALSALEPQERDGWKLVPVEPTEEMIAEGEDTKIGDRYCGKFGAKAVYRAMLAAAPSPSREETETRDHSALLLEAEKALEPFAKEAEELADGIPDDTEYCLHMHYDLGLSDFNVGHLRAARSTLSKIRGGE